MPSLRKLPVNTVSSDLELETLLPPCDCWASATGSFSYTMLM